MNIHEFIRWVLQYHPYLVDSWTAIASHLQGLDDGTKLAFLGGNPNGFAARHILASADTITACHLFGEEYAGHHNTELIQAVSGAAKADECVVQVTRGNVLQAPLDDVQAAILEFSLRDYDPDKRAPIIAHLGTNGVPSVSVAGIFLQHAPNFGTIAGTVEAELEAVYEERVAALRGRLQTSGHFERFEAAFNKFRQNVVPGQLRRAKSQQSDRFDTLETLEGYFDAAGYQRTGTHAVEDSEFVRVVQFQHAA